MGLRSFMDEIAPHFEEGGKLRFAYPAYEAVDTALYTPGFVTGGSTVTLEMAWTINESC